MAARRSVINFANCFTAVVPSSGREYGTKTTFSAVYPSSRMERARSITLADSKLSYTDLDSPPPRCVYMRTLSRTLPPRRR
jgi:hypothetical protein